MTKAPAVDRAALLARVEQNTLEMLIAAWRNLARLERLEADDRLAANNVAPANLSYHTAVARERTLRHCAEGLENTLRDLATLLAEEEKTDGPKV